MAKDCLVFMEREGVCKRWFMHDVMHKWEKGCQYERCKYKHARPTTTPEGAPAAGTVTCSATTTRTLPTELRLADLAALNDANKPLLINTTSVYVSRDGFWMQPEVDAQLCSGCGSEHGMMQPCAMHGGYHSLMLTDVRRDIDAIKCRWVPMAHLPWLLLLGCAECNLWFQWRHEKNAKEGTSARWNRCCCPRRGAITAR